MRAWSAAPAPETARKRLSLCRRVWDVPRRSSTRPLAGPALIAVAWKIMSRQKPSVYQQTPVDVDLSPLKKWEPAVVMVPATVDAHRSRSASVLRGVAKGRNQESSSFAKVTADREIRNHPSTSSGQGNQKTRAAFGPPLLLSNK